MGCRTRILLAVAALAAGIAAPAGAPAAAPATPSARSGTAGKVALVDTTTRLGCNGGSAPCSPAALATIVDLVGYGGADFFEGAAAAPTPSNTTAAVRRDSGCQDTDGNGADFTAAAPTPRGTASPPHACGGPGPTAIASRFPAAGAADVPVDANVTITFNQATTVSGDWFTIA